jgi:hypothetical protein
VVTVWFFPCAGECGGKQQSKTVTGLTVTLEGLVIPLEGLVIPLEGLVVNGRVLRAAKGYNVVGP